MAKSYYDRGKKSIRKYLDENTDHIGMTVQKGTKDTWKAAAKLTGTTMTRYVMESVNNRITTCIESGIIPDITVEAVRAAVLSEDEQDVTRADALCGD